MDNSRQIGSIEMDLNSARSELRYPPVLHFSEIFSGVVIAMAIAGGLLLVFS
jgi:hypothetical protein